MEDKLQKALVLGGGGFIGNHMVNSLKQQGFWVRAVDLKKPDFSTTNADDFILGDLTDFNLIEKIINDKNKYSEIYQFAADMGGAGYIFTGDNDANIMNNSALINLNVLKQLSKTDFKDTNIFYSSSACIYPEHNQLDPNNPDCKESSAYPAAPDSEYGWEKLFSERLYFAYQKNFGINVSVARYHNIFGPLGTWDGGKEKAPAAICRKISQAEDNSTIEVWGDGNQTRSFLYIDECIKATQKLLRSNFSGPVNIGSEEMVSINELVDIVSRLSNKKINIKHKLDAPQGVRGRNSNNDLIKDKLNWNYEMSLSEGLEKTYGWINEQVNLSKL
jgi:GDP-D-mannose 3',5'-epimerase